MSIHFDATVNLPLRDLDNMREQLRNMGEVIKERDELRKRNALLKGALDPVDAESALRSAFVQAVRVCRLAVASAGGDAHFPIDALHHVACTLQDPALAFAPHLVEVGQVFAVFARERLAPRQEKE